MTTPNRFEPRGLRLSLLAIFMSAAMVLSASPASAADAPKGKARTIRLDEISVEGRIQKPQAFYILPRSNLNYSALERHESLLPKIRKAVDGEPF